MSLKVTLLGTGVGIPQPGRSQAAILVESEEQLLLDCGAGTLLPVSYTHLRAHETVLDLVCRLLLEKKKKKPT